MPLTVNDMDPNLVLADLGNTFADVEVRAFVDIAGVEVGHEDQHAVEMDMVFGPGGSVAASIEVGAVMGPDLGIVVFALDDIHLASLHH